MPTTVKPPACFLYKRKSVNAIMQFDVLTKYNWPAPRKNGGRAVDSMRVREKNREVALAVSEALLITSASPRRANKNL